MKCYVELPCDNVGVIANEIYQYIKDKTTAINTPRLVASFTFYREPLQWLK